MSTRSYSNVTSGANQRVQPRRNILEEIRSEIMEKVNKQSDITKLNFAKRYCTLENFKRNLVCVSECKEMQKKKEKLIQQGYQFGNNVSDKNSKIECINPNGKTETVRLCSDPHCTYYHTTSSKRTETICMHDLFGVCSHPSSHHNMKHGCSVYDLPSYCINRMDCGSYTIFYYHDQIRYYSKKEKHTFVYEFANKQQDKLDSNYCLTITDVLDVNKRRELMFKLQEVCSIVHRMFMEVGNESTYFFPLSDRKDNNTYISSIPQLFGAFVYKTLDTNERFAKYKEDKCIISGMLMELTNTELADLADLSNLQEMCEQAFGLLHESK